MNIGRLLGMADGLQPVWRDFAQSTVEGTGHDGRMQVRMLGVLTMVAAVALDWGRRGR